MRGKLNKPSQTRILQRGVAGACRNSPGADIEWTRAERKGKPGHSGLVGALGRGGRPRRGSSGKKQRYQRDFQSWRFHADSRSGARRAMAPQQHSSGISGDGKGGRWGERTLVVIPQARWRDTRTRSTSHAREGSQALIPRTPRRRCAWAGKHARSSHAFPLRLCFQWQFCHRGLRRTVSL